MNNSPHPTLEKAFDHFQTADHLFHTTLPIAKDPKLLLAIVKSISNSLEYALESILSKEKMPAEKGLLPRVKKFLKIATPQLAAGYEPNAGINSFRPLAKRYNVSTDDITFMLRIHEILYHQQQSSVEFKRGSSHIICSEDYDLEVLSTKEVELFLQQTKRILHNLKTL